MRTLAIFSLVLAILSNALAQGPPQPADSKVKGTSFLDHDTPIKDFWGQTFLKENIPYLDIPDQNIQDVYYYRFSSLQRHLRYILPGTGYMITEFMQPVDYAGAFGSINAAAGHHIEEAQWLRSSFYDQDYTALWTRGPGNSSQYTHWIMEAAASAANVTGELGFLQSQLQGMIRMWHEWDYTFDGDVGLYYYTPLWDAQEYSLPGFVATDGVDNDLERIGPNTYRPSHNAYMVANARSIAATAGMLGQKQVESTFTKYANKLEKAIYKHLWDPKQKFFVDVVRSNNTNVTPLHGREEVGFYPFRFGLGQDASYANPAMEQLFNPNGFLTDYGPPTLERRNQWYTAEKPTDYCCFWQGQSWPFSTAHTLKSLADVIQSGESNVTTDQYHQLLSIYATTQHKNGAPYVAESHYPEKDAWSADSYNHSENYMHSTNNHNVITGLIGLIPRADDTLEVSPIVPSEWTYFALENVPYHGFLITILYDKDGSRYNAGAGLSLYANGKKIYHGKKVGRVTAQLPGNHAQQPDSSSKAPMPVNVNVAANPYGLGLWPRASATYTWIYDDPYKAIDGVLFYDSEPDNRWTNYNSSNSNDTLTIQLPRPRNLTGIILAIYDDSNRTPTGSVACPASIEITDADGKVLVDLSDFASQCLPNDRNIIAFDNVAETDTVHINFFSQKNLAVGVCEVEMWLPPNTGPFYYAVDALAQTDAEVAFDTDSQTISNGAVLALTSANAEIDFSGIYSARGGSKTLRIDYKNNGTSTPSISVAVNQVAAGTATLAKTQGSGYSGVEVKKVQLQKGLNYISLLGGDDGVFIDGLGVM